MNSDATMCGIYKTESTPEFDVKDKPTNPIEEQLLRLTNSPFTSMDLDKGIFIPDNAYTGFGSTINQ